MHLVVAGRRLSLSAPVASCNSGGYLARVVGVVPQCSGANVVTAAVCLLVLVGGARLDVYRRRIVGELLEGRLAEAVTVAEASSAVRCSQKEALLKTAADQA